MHIRLAILTRVEHGRHEMMDGWHVQVRSKFQAALHGWKKEEKNERKSLQKAGKRDKNMSTELDWNTQLFKQKSSSIAFFIILLESRCDCWCYKFCFECIQFLWCWLQQQKQQQQPGTAAGGGGGGQQQQQGSRFVDWYYVIVFCFSILYLWFTIPPPMCFFFSFVRSSWCCMHLNSSCSNKEAVVRTRVRIRGCRTAATPTQLNCTFNFLNSNLPAAHS